MAKTWEEVKAGLNLTEEDLAAIELEEELIEMMIKIREEKGLTQEQVAKLCNVHQPMIARLEKATHSPRVDSLLKILVPLGYKLQIVPIKQS